MARRTPLPHYKHFASALKMDMRFHENIDFNLPLNATNLANTMFNDRYDYINYMYIGVNTPTGYVLGNVVPASAGRTFSLSGTDSSRFAIGSSTGQITLTNNSGLSAGNLSINVVVSDLGTLPVTVPVVSTASSAIFFDSVGGDDGNSGLEPHLAKATYTYAAATGKLLVLLKRGTSQTVSLKFGNSNVIGAYGDPSADRPHVRPTAGATAVIVNAYKPNGIDYQGCSSVTIRDLYIDGNNDAINGMYVYNVNGMTIKRCTITGTRSDVNASGIRVSNVSSNIVIRHNETVAVNGDGCYLVASSTGEIAFNKFSTPFGGTADCLQITGENNYNERCADMWVHHNILDYGASTTSVKGAVVIQETSGYLFEYNFVRGNYFGVGAVGSRGTIRANYVYNCRMSPTNSNEWCMGVGAPQYSTELHHYDNFLMRSQRGFYISSGSPAGIWDRTDFVFVGNTVSLSTYAARATERWTGLISGNIMALNGDNAFSAGNSNGSTVASVTGSISAFANGGSGSGTFTFTANHKLGVGDTFTVSGMSQSGLNGLKTVVTAPTATTVTISISGSETAETGASGSYTKSRTYTTQTTSGNTAQSQLGSQITTVPSISGTCQDGQTVTASTTAQSGITYAYQWCLDGLDISGATVASYSIPAATSTGVNKSAPSNSSLNKPRLSCRITATDVGGRKSFVMAVWPSGLIYERVVA